MTTFRVRPRELNGLLSTLRLEIDDNGEPTTHTVIVDLDDVDAADQVAVPPYLAVVIGVATRPLTLVARRLAAHLDTTLVPAQAEASDVEVGVDDVVTSAGVVVDSVVRWPRAATALVQLLRGDRQVPFNQGIAAESVTYSMLLAGSEFARWRAQRTRYEVPTLPNPVLLERTNDRLSVTINRPGRRNAFDRTVRDALVEAFDLALADDSLSAIDLRGAGPAFCSGGDLDEFGTATDVSTAHLIRLDRSLAARVNRCSSRVTAHLHGACIGAGIEIPSFAGHVRAAEDTFCQLPEVSMGLIPGAGGTVGIPRRIGRWRTTYLALTGARIDASTACRWGLIDEIVRG